IISIAIPLLVIYIARTFLLDPLSRIPGPLSARFSRIWMVQHSIAGDMHTTMIALPKKHGKLVRTAPKEVSISDPTAIKIIYGAGTKFRKSDWYSVWQGHRKFDLFGGRDEKVHGQHRRLISSIYSLDQLRKLEGGVDTAISFFIDKLENGSSVDMSEWAQLFAFDIIGEVTFSKPFGFLAAGKDDGSFKAIDEALVSATWIGQVLWLCWWHDRLMPVIGNWLGVNNRNGNLRQFAAKECEARKGRKSERNDILTSLFAVKEAKPQEFDDKSLLSMASSNIFAGSDTTGISIGAVMYNIFKHPRCKQRLLEEIEETVQKKGLDARKNMTFEAGFAMPYLQACIYEALRIHPAVGMSLPRVVPKDGFEIKGGYLPGGVSANPWVIHRQKEIFGNDCETFRAERWLERDRGQLDCFFLAFGSGARMCLGRNLSWIEMTKLVPSILMRFDVELADKSKDPMQHCWQVSHNLT
ncbi:cytochrome P450, partial [Ampelomyces quisqualis]